MQTLTGLNNLLLLSFHDVLHDEYVLFTDSPMSGIRFVFREAGFLPAHLRPPQQHQHPPVCAAPAGRYDIITPSHSLKETPVSLTSSFFRFHRGLGPVGLGSQRPRVPATLRHGRDEGRGHAAAEEPLLPVPDRAAGALQGGSLLRASLRQPVHGKQSGGRRHQGAAAAALQQDQVRRCSTGGSAHQTLQKIFLTIH